MIDTTAWMIAGYGTATVLYVSYVLTLWTRARRVRDVIMRARGDLSATPSDPLPRAQ